MARTLLMLLSLLLCTGWMVAQAQSQGMSKGQMGKSEAAQTKVEGCLQGENGNFTLTNAAGKVYQLQGDNSKLSEHVGHEVRIEGSKEPGSSSAASSSEAQSVLQVESIKHISKTCKAASKMSK